MREPVAVDVVLYAMNRGRYCALRATMPPKRFQQYWRRDALAQIEFALTFTGQAPPAHRELHHAREFVLAGLADPSTRLFRDAQDCITRAIDRLRETAEEWAEV